MRLFGECRGETVGETGCAPAIFGWGETTAGQPVAAGEFGEGVGALVEEVTVVATDPADVDAVAVLTDSPLRLDQTGEPDRPIGGVPARQDLVAGAPAVHHRDGLLAVGEDGQRAVPELADRLVDAAQFGDEHGLRTDLLALVGNAISWYWPSSARTPKPVIPRDTEASVATVMGSSHTT